MVANLAALSFAAAGPLQRSAVRSKRATVPPAMIGAFLDKLYKLLKQDFDYDALARERRASRVSGRVRASGARSCTSSGCRATRSRRHGPSLALARGDDYDVALEGGHHRRVGDARIVPYYLPDHHIAEPPRRKLTSAAAARVSSALRVVRPAVVSVVAGGASGTLRVRMTTSKEARNG